jgi:prepilin-type processing-associated H-X9-DG protein
MDQSGNPTQPFQSSPVRTSRLAIASFVMGLVSLVICVLWPILALPAIICGIVALVKISGSAGALKGKGYAITGIILPAVMAILLPFLAMFAAVMMPALNQAKTMAQRITCASNMRQSTLAMIMYANDSSGQLPEKNWTDAIKEKGFIKDDKIFICPETAEQTISYALNKNIKNINTVKRPSQTVLIFEADLGAAGTGGPEEIVFRHKNGTTEGCNIGFVDGHTEFVTKEDIGNLHWTTGEDKEGQP